MYVYGMRQRMFIDVFLLLFVRKNVNQCFRSKNGKHNLSPSTRVPEVERDMGSAADCSRSVWVVTANGNKLSVTVVTETT